MENLEEQQYLDLIKDTIENGYELDDRTGDGCFVKIGAMIRHNLRNNTLPVCTTRKTFFRGAVEELLWLLRGDTSIKSLQEKNIHIWDGNTTSEFIKNRGLEDIVPEGNVGTLYGFQIRNWNGDWDKYIKTGERTGIDQLKKVIDQLNNNKSSRRILVSNYNVSQLETGVLEPCHTIYTFNLDVKKKEIHSLLWMRSVDLSCGFPLNSIHLSLLTHIFAKMTGYTAGDFVFQASNAHVYKTHVEKATIQCSRKPYPYPKIKINKEIKDIKDIESLTFVDFELINYMHHEAIKYPMSV